MANDVYDKLFHEKLQNGLKIKLHVGCGDNYFDGWINIDSDTNRKLDINLDLRQNLPFEDNSIDYIYNEHFLEHLTVEEGQRVIKEFMRVLKPEGVLRIAMPDLEISIAEYLNPNWKENPSLKKWGLDFIQTKAELINIAFRWWEHKWLYDGEELERRLREAGCVNIVRCNLRESLHKDLNNLETRDESTLIMEVIK